MRSETLKEIQRLCEDICWENRLSGSKGNKKVRKLIKSYLRENNIPFFSEKFEITKVIPLSASLRSNGSVYEAIPLVGSLWGETAGEVVVIKDWEKIKSSDVAGKIVATPVGGTRDEEKAKILREKKAAALITYMEELNTNFSGTLGNTKFLAVNTKREVVEELKGKEIILQVRTEKRKIECENIVVEFGRGPFVYLIAHYDTKPFVYGAIDNGVAVAFLLAMVRELIEYEDLPFRIRVLFTDAEELGLEGSRYHTRELKNTIYAINVDSIGWKNPAVLYKDYYGENGRKINDKFFRHVLEMKVDIPFVASKTGASDHVPFKEKGVETLFLSSNPFTIRHTELDDYYAIDWEVVRMWYDVLAYFVRKLHRL